MNLLARIALVFLFLPAIATAADPQLELVSAERIWDAAPHNAFTDLIRYHDRWFCVSREGQSHVSPDGALRVITSTDGDHWESAALITSPDSDLRDAKITITPDGKLMLAGAEALNEPQTHKHQSLVWFSEDGETWSEAHEVGDPDNWLWRITWHNGAAYGFGYKTGTGERFLRLYRSEDGQNFDTLIQRVDVEGTYPNETSMVFLPDDTCYCLLRQDGQPNNGCLGTSHPPYTDWTWQKFDTRIGGPHMLRLPDGRLIAAVRLYDQPVRTSLCWIDPDEGSITEALKLPSGGDTSYAGLVWHNDLLWISYYSSHEEKTAIYLAQVKITTP